MNVKTERAVATDVLIDVLESGAFANIALRKAFKDNLLSRRGRALVTDIVNETLRNLILIDHTIAGVSSTRLHNMKPFIRNVLRISVCQMLFIENIPARAAISEAVNITKQYGFESLSGFVNAVLRNIDRQVPSDIKAVALKYSYPQWLMEKLTQWLGHSAAAEFCKNSHKIPPVIVLANLKKTSFEELVQALNAEGVETTPLEQSKHPLLILHKPGDITALESFQKGMFFVIDPGALTAIDAVSPKAGQVIIDMCAAPGGKSFAMAGLMQGKGRIVACDIHPHRLGLITQTRKRLGHNIIEAELVDGTVFNPKFEGVADTVLLDAPCSGFGTIRKHPEIKYTRNMADVIELTKIQRRMLAVAAQYVKPGGKLVYCTCTVSKDENQDTVAFFEKTHSGFKHEGSTQTMPSQVSDAFFVATFRRALCC